MIRTGLSKSCWAALAMLTLAGCKPASPAETKSVQPATVAPPAATPTRPAASTAPATALPEISVSLAPAPAQPGDVPGSHDIGFLKRFQGAQIIGYLSHPYDRITVSDSTGDTAAEHGTAVEGAVTRIIYRIPVGHSALEVLRNYEDLAKSEGMQQTSEVTCSSKASDFPRQVFQQIPFGALTDPFFHEGANAFPDTPWCYFAARAMADGRPLTLAVLVTEKHLFLDRTGVDGKPLVFKEGEVVVGVDVVVAKPVTNQMVTVKAADMADALASKGVVDLYGILFDTDKTEVKPDSAPTLAEVASLLKIDRSLKLEVSGHTDNSGDKAHNMALSQGRADAVKAMLVSKYGIDAARLTTKGYGDTKPVAGNDTPANMAKNRRVELRKI